ncbi:MAG: hypothetical protein DIJKHBIC_02840 [Thermoanaerobaculia bacterium]|nr:hypothetical protein [Thermoanaerobaculia bacterium]
MRMSGPCDCCGETADELLAVGTVADFVFRPDFAYCRVCYDRYNGRHDELHPEAVAEQRAPRLISRPDDVSDIE